jgi:integrase
MQRLNEEAGREDTDRRFLDRIMHDALRRLGHEHLKDEPTLECYLRDWLSNSKQGVAETTYAKYDLAVRLFWQTVNGAKRLTEINPQDVQRWQDALMKSGRSPGTVNLMRNIIKIPFKLAKDSGVIERNPCLLVKPMKVQKVQRGVFLPEQIQSILAVCDSEWRGLVLFGFYSGQRLGDLSRLRWQDVSDGTIAIRQGKTGNQVQIPLHPALSEWIAQVPRSSRSQYVFASLWHKPISDLSKKFSSLVCSSGVANGLIRQRCGGKSRNLSGLSFHSLRWSFTTYLCNAGIPVETRQKLTGHSSAEMNIHYSKMDISVLRSAISTLPSLC